MKKSLATLILSGFMAVSVNAQEQSGGGNALTNALGSLSAPVAGGIAAASVLTVALVSNNRGTNSGQTETPVELVCDEGDALVDDVCIGTTTTVTVTASGTGTATTTIPVTFTYLPTAQ